MSELLAGFDHAVRRAAPASLYTGEGPDAEEAAEDAALSEAEHEPGPGDAAHILGSRRGDVYLARLHPHARGPVRGPDRGRGRIRGRIGLVLRATPGATRQVDQRIVATEFADR